MAKFTKNIERMIAELGKDQKMIDMHGVNITRRNALRDRRADLCRLFLAAYRYCKNGSAVIGYDDREAKKAAIRRGIVEKFNGDVGKAIRAYSAVGKEDNQGFNSLFYEVARELQEEQENDLREWCESKAEKLARLTGEDKAAIVDRLGGRTSDREYSHGDTVKDIDKDLSPKAINQRINSCKNKKDLDDLLDSLDALGCDYDFLDDKINKKYREFSGYRVNRI